MDEGEGKPVVENVWPAPETQGSEQKRKGDRNTCPRRHTQKKKYPVVKHSAICFGLWLHFSPQSYIYSKDSLHFQEAESEAVEG